MTKLDLAILLRRFDADLRRGNTAEIVIESAMLTTSVTIRPTGMAVSGPTAMIGARM